MMNRQVSWRFDQRLLRIRSLHLTRLITNFLSLNSPNFIYEVILTFISMAPCKKHVIYNLHPKTHFTKYNFCLPLFHWKFINQQ